MAYHYGKMKGAQSCKADGKKSAPVASFSDYELMTILNGCESDIERFCVDMKKVAEKASCLKEHESELTSKCADSFPKPEAAESSE